MKLSMPVKIIIGLLTAWELILPLVFFVVWFSFISSIAFTQNQPQPEITALPTIFIPIFPILFCSSFLLIGLHAFYIVHIILNKAGGDVIRAVLGVSLIIIPFLALPVYFFIYILPKNPPGWALNVIPGRAEAPQPVEITPSPSGH